MLATVLRNGLVAWLLLLAVIVALRLLDGRVKLSGLLARSSGHAAAGLVSPERVQLLAAFALALAAYVRLVLNLMHQPGRHDALPPVPAELIALFAASHSIYLGGKLGWLFNLKRFIDGSGG
jgi:hypothetical protein